MSNLRLFRKALAEYNMAVTAFDKIKSTGEVVYLENVAEHVKYAIKSILEGYLYIMHVDMSSARTITDLIALSRNKKSPCIITQWLDTHKTNLTDIDEAYRRHVDMSIYYETYFHHDIDADTFLHEAQNVLDRVKDFLVVNGICDELLNAINKDVKRDILKRVQLCNVPRTSMEWYVMYITYRESLRKIV